MEKFKGPYLGAAYYPEDWPLEQIDDDIAIMKQVGMNVMRVGEFAWSRMEPKEGEYDFDWLHLAIDKLKNANIAVIIGTPTCTPPIWLAEKYPEILVVNDKGIRAQHGGRRHACPNNPVYREYCGKIVTKLAQEFGKDENVIGWQIDNELYPEPRGGRGCCCPVCHKKFQETMKKKFGGIDTLNSTWGTDLWSQTYQSFSQLPIPRTDTWHHPSFLTAWMDFQSDSYIDFTKQQADILHKMCKQPIGTDMMCMCGINYHKIHQCLDFVQVNNYHEQHNLWQVIFWYDMIRPIKSKPFWNTETSTCWPGSVTANKYRPVGYCRANSWLPIALGGEAVLYWLWRAHWSGQELMHGAVISSCGRGLHVVNEVKDIADGFKKCAEFINETKPVNSGLAVHFSCFASLMFDFQPMVNDFKYTEKLINSFYRPLMDASLRADVIDPAVSLEEYKVVCSPFLPALDESDLRKRILSWIKAGGTWVVGPMSDIRTMDGTKYTKLPFGSLEEWMETYCDFQIPGDPQDFELSWADGDKSQGSIWYDCFKKDNTDVLAEYTQEPLKGRAAIIKKKLGKGQIILLGTMPEKESLKKLLLSVCGQAGIVPVVQSSENLLAVPRKGKTQEGIIAVEFENRPATLKIDRPAEDLLTGKKYKGKVEVEPYGVVVLQYKK
jgi:beta-galactosidase